MARPISKTYGVWNPIPQKMVKQIIAYYLEGHSTVETGEKFGIANTCVGKLLRKNGLDTRGLRYKTGDKEKEIIAYYLSGMSSLKTAEFFGIGKTIVLKILKRNNIKTRTRKKSILEKRITKNIWEKRKKETIPLYKLEAYLRSRVHTALRVKGYKKKTKMYFLLGADFAFIKNYLEDQFREGMSWDNYGQWHVDHRKPLATAQNEEELLALFHYSNLQPLWAVENLKKNSFYNGKRYYKRRVA